MSGLKTFRFLGNATSNIKRLINNSCKTFITFLSNGYTVPEIVHFYSLCFTVMASPAYQHYLSLFFVLYL